MLVLDVAFTITTCVNFAVNTSMRWFRRKHPCGEMWRPPGTCGCRQEVSASHECSFSLPPTD
jgi:hypothetical protein